MSWSTKKYGPEYDLKTREELLGKDNGLFQILCSIRLPGVGAARRVNAAKTATLKNEDPPEDIVAPLMRAMEDVEKQDLGEGFWMSGRSEMMQQVYEYLDDLRAHYLALKSSEAKDEKKAEGAQAA